MDLRIDTVIDHLSRGEMILMLNDYCDDEIPTSCLTVSELREEVYARANAGDIPEEAFLG